MNSRKTSDRSDSRRPKRRSKGNSGGLLIFLVGGLLFCFLSAGGIGTGAYFYFRGGATKTGDKQLEQNRFQGRWQGTRPGSGRLKLHLRVDTDTFAFTAINFVVHEGATLQYRWKTVKSTDKTLIIRHERFGNFQPREWLITFKSADVITVQDIQDNGTIGEFTRLTGDAPNEDQIYAKERARLVGKWDAPTFNSLDLRDANLEFKADGTAVFDVNYAKGRKTVNGTWRVLPQIQPTTLNVQIIGIDMFDQMIFEFENDDQIHFTRFHNGTGGVRNSARRVK